MLFDCQKTLTTSGNDCLYIVRELQSDVTLLATNLEESSWENLSEQLFEPLKSLANELKLAWPGMASSATHKNRSVWLPPTACQASRIKPVSLIACEMLDS
jgi:hypothetical protein